MARTTTAKKSRKSAPAVPAAFSHAEAKRLAQRLLVWYDRHRRVLPWRARAGERADPYRVWLSEIMLQQTTVATVGPYFRAFLERWPDVHALAAASLDEVLHAWQGLGYYARARHLHECAKVVSRDLGGRFPSTEQSLRELPGIGPYTAAAIAAIAFERKASVVDGNVERVVARLRAVATPMPAAKTELRALAAGLAPETRPGDFAQATMDLGAVICTPRRPRCMLCPWREDCRAHAMDIAETLPRRAAKRPRPVRRGTVFWLVRGGAELLLRKRPARGLLGGLMELPSTDWRAESWALADAKRFAPVRARWRALPGTVRHVFTHFELELTVLAAQIDDGRGGAGVKRFEADSVGETVGKHLGVNEGQGPRWCRLDRLSDYALPTVMRKVVEHALANGG